MIEDYLQQPLTHERVASVDAYNKKTYTQATILGRLDGANVLARSKTGEVLTCTTQVTTLTPLQPGDRINGREVMRAEPIAWGDGSISHYEGYLV